ncbi:glycosyltransferase [Luteimonas sp. MC1750]|uniref:glycosyltransferase family 2 protein n=2 Tax=Luteimonas sp. MC1750 TaxID=2799326 RepID=UPI0031BAFC57
MTMPSVSVIVPVYNGERFIEECLRSISGQRLDDVEIIVVDDGSTDGTAAICREYVAKERRARFIQKENAGVSAARNSGLDLAKGRYIAFVDADDWVTEDGLVHLLGKANASGADIVMGDYLIFDNGRTVRQTLAPVNTAQQVLTRVLSGEYHSALWNKLVRRELMLTARFPEEIGYLEDSVVLSRILVNGQPGVAFVNEVVYVYRQHGDAVTLSGGRKLLDLLTAHRLIAECLQEFGVEDAAREVLPDKIHRGTWFVLTMIDESVLDEAVSQARLHFHATRTQRRFASAGIKPMILNGLLRLPQPIAVAGFRAVRGVLTFASPARRKLVRQARSASNGAG